MNGLMAREIVYGSILVVFGIRMLQVRANRRMLNDTITIGAICLVAGAFLFQYLK